MRLYSALLLLYPTSFGIEYADEMRAIFAARLKAAQNPAERTRVYAAAVAEVLGNAAAAHWDVLRQDLAYAARTIAHAPGYATTAVAVIALGIGANTAVFSVADFVMLRPLPYADGDRIMKLWQTPLRTPGIDQVSPATYRDWRKDLRSFESMGAYYSGAVNLVGEGEPRRLMQAVVTADLLPVLGVAPARGRLLAEDDVDAVVLSHRIWDTQFAGDPDIVGRRVLMDGNPRIVAGVMPPHFHFPSATVDLWSLIDRETAADEARDNVYWEVVARLKPGVSQEQAAAEVRALTARLRENHSAAMEDVSATVLPMRDGYSSQPRMILLALVGAAACVLLIACANLANLLLARALLRRRELLVRSALGANRERLVRQSITESLALATLGGTLGVALAAVATPLLARLVPATLPVANAPSVDPRAMAFAAALTVLTGLLFGAFPAWRAAHEMELGLASGGRSGVRRARARYALVAVEVATSVVLLVCAGLLLRALLQLQQLDLGFRTDGVMTLRTALPSPGYDVTARRATFYEAVLGEVRAIPGVERAAYITSLPIAGIGGVWSVIPEGAPSGAEVQRAASRFVTADYFATMGIPLLRGRDVAATDGPDATPVAVVSASFAQRYWPDADPIGRRFKFPEDMRTVVGVVGDVGFRGPEQRSEPQVYLSYRQVRDGDSLVFSPKDLVIRSSLAPAALVPRVRDIVRRVDPQQPVSDVRPLQTIVDNATAARSVQVTILVVFAGLGALLAAVGIHGLLAYAVSSRQHEIGVRLALGAQRADVVRLVLREASLLAAAGVIPGVAIAYAVARAMQSLLAGIDPGDAATYLAVALLCAGMVVLGSLAPTLRAARVDPAGALRAEA